MKILHKISSLFLAGALVLASCSEYDDSQLWKNLDEVYNSMTDLDNQLKALENQASMISALVQGGVITSITDDGAGNYTISYKGKDNVQHTAVIATKNQVNNAPILGTKEKDGVLYWTLTQGGKTTFITDNDGSLIPVAGRTPQLGVDSEGYWTVNGIRLKDASGNPIKADGKSVSLVSAVETDADGNLVLTLADGSKIVATVFKAFSVELTSTEGTFAGDTLKLTTQVPSAVVSCKISGPNAAQTFFRITKAEGLSAVVDDKTSTIALTMADGFEKGSFTILAADVEQNILIRIINVINMSAVPDYYGIKTAADWQSFVEAWNNDASLTRFRDEKGDIFLASDVDFAGADIVPVGTDARPFDGVFDGKGFSIKGINTTIDVVAKTYAGLFGFVNGGTVRNLTLGAEGDLLTITGNVTAAGPVAGAIAARVDNGHIEDCVNNVNLKFEGDDADNIVFCFGGIVGMGCGAEIVRCTNNGFVETGKISNSKAGATGFQIGGIIGIVKPGTNSSSVMYSVNNGHVSCPTGRGGGIAGTQTDGVMASCVNNGLVEDDVVGQFGGGTAAYGQKRMGGIAGGITGAEVGLAGCINKGNVISYVGCRTGGLVGHNEGLVLDCENSGIILSDNGASTSKTFHGAGWGCGYNKTKTSFKRNSGYGRVGETSVHLSNPETAPAACHNNAVRHQNSTYDPENNYVDDTIDSYYDWTATDTKVLGEGVTYTKYEFNNLPRKIYVLEVDLTKPNVEITTSMADDIVPNPNGNNNANNGKNIRELLSENCERKRAEGQNIVAGFNTGFFDSNDGILRGMHVEEGEVVYLNNEGVRKSLGNHKMGFAVLQNRTPLIGTKEITGKVSFNGSEIAYYSVNDTIVRHGTNAYPANVYTNRYVKTPHEGLTNALATNLLYVVAKNNAGSRVTVNTGWIDATVTAVYDGRTTALPEAPYLTANDEWAIQATGASAVTLASAKPGDAIKIRCDATMAGSTSPIYTLNSSMFQFMKDGNDNLSTCNNHDQASLNDPMTYVGINKEGTTVYFVAVDGRQDWVSLGVTFTQAYYIMKKLGAWNVTRFDGGGSTAMWVYADGKGGLVNVPSDSKGERSCMNYMHIRIK